MKVGVFCRDPLMGDGLRCLLASLPSVTSVVQATTAAELRLFLDKPVDSLVVTVDGMEPRDLAALDAARQNLRCAIVIVDSEGAPATMLRPIADAFVSRSEGFSGIDSALRMLGRARSRVTARIAREPAMPFGLARDLTPREREVARLVSKGMPNRSIANLLGIQEQSVKNLVSGVMRKMACENRTQLALQLSSSTY